MNKKSIKRDGGRTMENTDRKQEGIRDIEERINEKTGRSLT